MQHQCTPGQIGNQCTIMQGCLYCQDTTSPSSKPFFVLICMLLLSKLKFLERKEAEESEQNGQSRPCNIVHQMKQNPQRKNILELLLKYFLDGWAQKRKREL